MLDEPISEVAPILVTREVNGEISFGVGNVEWSFCVLKHLKELGCACAVADGAVNWIGAGFVLFPAGEIVLDKKINDLYFAARDSVEESVTAFTSGELRVCTGLKEAIGDVGIAS